MSRIKGCSFSSSLIGLVLPSTRGDPGKRAGYSMGFGGVGNRGGGVSWILGIKGRERNKEKPYLSQGPVLPGWVESALRLGEGAAQV